MAHTNGKDQLVIPPIGLGTGGATHLTSSECTEVVATAIDLGYRHIDTAVMYGNHEGVGRGIEHSTIPRDDLLLATKIPPEKLAYSALIECLEESKRELGVERIDIGYVHFPSGEYDPEDTFAALDESVDRGVLSHIGVSNFTEDELRTALDHTDHGIAVHQIEYHPLWQQPDILEYSRNEGLEIVTYAPLARGRVLSLDPILEIAEKHHTSPASVALAWLTTQLNVSTIVKSTNPDHLAANLQAPSLDLDDEDARKIEAIEERTRLVNPAEY